ncbi:hypothetical protein CYMTET_22396 [Cymbomonas tetramitiformis]|uniref:Uncharacterized protein n=1 Tax=Cymbomonas tetramitiformis TaxID=36881 RepID=A0AAE0L1Y5_9CHLO|nr:hypothetical protein CYMTET_22396 [Cymbomonas tetramitiformis]
MDHPCVPFKYRNVLQRNRRNRQRAGRRRLLETNDVVPVFLQPDTWRRCPTTLQIQPFTEEEQAFALVAGITPWTEYPSIKIGREDFRVHDSDIGLKSSHRYFKSIFCTPGVPTPAQVLSGEIPDDDIEDRYGEIMKIVKLDVPGREIFLLKARWYPKVAALADDISKNIFLRKDMPWDVSQPFVRANSIENQVVIQDVPFMPAWLARYDGNTVPLAIRRRTDCLQVVLDRKADFFREIDDNSSSEDDNSSSSESDDCG